MKMVAASKLRHAERAMHPAKAYGEAAGRLSDKLKEEIKGNKHLIIVCTSDKGMCGAVNSSIAKNAKRVVEEANKKGDETMVAVIGEKGRLALSRTHAGKFVVTFNEFGRQAFNFAQASYIADQLLTSSFKFDKATVLSNLFKSVISYEAIPRVVASPEAMELRARGGELTAYEQEGDGGLLKNYQSLYLANTIFRAVAENAAVEQAARMNAMDNATSNASEMIADLTIQYNRQRQAVITRELIEIISGASAL